MAVTYEQIIAVYWAAVRRAELSYYTRGERLRRQGAARRYRVTCRRNGFPHAVGVCSRDCNH